MQMRIMRPLTIVTLLLAAGVAPALAQGGGGGGRPPDGTAAAAQQHGVHGRRHDIRTSTRVLPGMAGGPPDASKMVSPPLSWVNPPAGTKSFVLLLHDPDAHAAKAFDDITHWMVFNIPGDATSLPEGMKADSTGGSAGEQHRAFAVVLWPLRASRTCAPLHV